ncbi:MAG: ATP-binding cassette domain-containing protein, partial [Pseudomonadota bacterium]
MIIIDKLTKAFGPNKVVDEADTQFEKGKVTSIIGPNGAGKSTLPPSRSVNRDAIDSNVLFPAPLGPII